MRINQQKSLQKLIRYRNIILYIILMSGGEEVNSDRFHLTSFQSIEVVIQEDLIRLVRGDFATALKELLQHGLVEVSKA